MHPTTKTHPIQDFKGKKVKVIQVGLGTFGTFVQGDSGWIRFLFGATSRRFKGPLTGIGVDPVIECILPLTEQAASIGNVALIHGAVGCDTGTRTLFALPHDAEDNLKCVMKSAGTMTEGMVNVCNQLDFMRNMSRLDTPHPHYETCMEYINSVTQRDLREILLEKREVACYTFGDILRMTNTTGCELMLIDAEGADCEILRSMVENCKSRRPPQWPRVILFESRGFGNTPGRPDEDERTVFQLMNHGYHLVHSGGDTLLLHSQAMTDDPRFCRWADKHFTLTCEGCHWKTWPSKSAFKRETRGGTTQWFRGRWVCAWCATPTW